MPEATRTPRLIAYQPLTQFLIDRFKERNPTALIAEIRLSGEWLIIEGREPITIHDGLPDIENGPRFVAFEYHVMFC